MRWLSRSKSKIVRRVFAGPEAYVGAVDHLRVAHLTDLHFGRVTPVRIQREAVRMVNASSPDLVVLTGDFVCHSLAFLSQLRSVLSELEAPALAVLGNHDHWCGATQVRHALEQAGVAVLVNAHTTVTIRGQRLQIVGLDDAYTGHADLSAAVRGLRRDLPVLGLSHIAEEANAMWAAGIPFVLAGHTHAGQVNLGRLTDFTIGLLAGHQYIHGLYGSRDASAAKLNTGALYVGAGIGAGVVPFRWGERGRREVALFELGHAPGSYEEDHAEQSPYGGQRLPAWFARSR